MRIPGRDLDDCDPYPCVTEEEFCGRADIKEGISGRDRIVARGENTERQQVIAPHGDAAGRPMPRNANFPGSGRADDWGSDRPGYDPLDGPVSRDLGKGYGLPKSYSETYSDDPVVFGINPLAEGIAGDD